MEAVGLAGSQASTLLGLQALGSVVDAGGDEEPWTLEGPSQSEEAQVPGALLPCPLSRAWPSICMGAGSTHMLVGPTPL